jgi:hypothetical protein
MKKETSMKALKQAPNHATRLFSTLQNIRELQALVSKCW